MLEAMLANGWWGQARALPCGERQTRGVWVPQRRTVAAKEEAVTLGACLLLLLLFRGTLAAHGGSQARGLRGAAAAMGLHGSRSNARSDPRLRPSPQLTAMPGC